MTITNAQFGLDLEDNGETITSIETTLRRLFNLNAKWGFSLSRGGMSQGLANGGLQPMMSVHFYLITPITNIHVVD